eukprot:snap_masked-scaffold_6-processed-gene-16.54-mRNA-1 protein AED:1.00 eAED:1.00 QI:0/0/0/0/1/1/2/0/99
MNGDTLTHTKRILRPQESGLGGMIRNAKKTLKRGLKRIIRSKSNTDKEKLKYKWAGSAIQLSYVYTQSDMPILCTEGFTIIRRQNAELDHTRSKMLLII